SAYGYGYPAYGYGYGYPTYGYSGYGYPAYSYYGSGYPAYGSYGGYYAPRRYYARRYYRYRLTGITARKEKPRPRTAGSSTNNRRASALTNMRIAAWPPHLRPRP